MARALVETALRSFEMNRLWAERLLVGIADEKLTHQPFAGANHPVWIIGHLCDTYDLIADWLRVPKVCPSGWHDLFSNQSTPSVDGRVYPAIDTLGQVYQEGHRLMADAFRGASDEVLAAPLPRERMRGTFPTVEDGVVFEMTDHESFHLGQLSAWRRAMGLGRG